MENNQIQCAACSYQQRRCSPECLLTPLFPPNKRDEFEVVARVFTAQNVIKLIKLAIPQQAIATESLIKEAEARIDDPVRGLTGTVHDLCRRIEDLRTELLLAKQQNDLHRRRNNLQLKQLGSSSTKEGTSSAVAAVPSMILQQLARSGDNPVPAPSNEKSCGACKYRNKKCSLQCPLATYFPPNRKEDFRNVTKVFGATNFLRLIKSADPLQYLAAESMIIEARARISDPVHGVAGIAETLSQQLDDLTSELANINQENRFLLQRERLLLQKNII
ncbi:hypothetical protein MKW98_016124 [Papaver atlanticum]|uniref:LOB domain-containing protein n=1 Tax=Papaver atlanticum TaxID=357466 RepID=A0AAD4XR30_9MAGN|nr:hypothetical protein MKW98_016124 [Papaver atlanticum]